MMRYVYLTLYTLALTCCTAPSPSAPDAGAAPADAELAIDGALPACPATGAPADCTRACVCVIDGVTCQAARGSGLGCR